MIRLERVTKDYRQPDGSVARALDGVSLAIEAGDMVAIVGSASSGISTLMNLLGLLALPHEGRYWVRGRDVSELSKPELARLRGRVIGFTIRTFEFLPELTVLDNVGLPLLYQSVRERHEAARQALHRVGLLHRFDQSPGQLYAAQRQRAFIARALISDPPILVIDQPVDALDSDAAREIMRLLTDLNDEGRTIIYSALHQQHALYAKRIVTLCEGTIVHDSANANWKNLKKMDRRVTEE